MAGFAGTGSQTGKSVLDGGQVVTPDQLMEYRNVPSSKKVRNSPACGGMAGGSAVACAMVGFVRWMFAADAERLRKDRDS